MKTFSRNLDLEAYGYRREDDGGGAFKVRVLNSPVGEQRESFAVETRLPPGIRDKSRRLEKRQLNRRQLIEFGEALGHSLFPPHIRTFLALSRHHVGADGLRVRLRLDSYALADVPWEYVYLSESDMPRDANDIGGFLLFDPYVSLVRYEVLGRTVGRLEPVGRGPLRIVSVLSNPATTRPLDLEREKQNINRALQGTTKVNAEFYPNVTMTGLLEAIAEGADIFHYAGHGVFEGELGEVYGSRDGQGYILLTGDDGGEVKFSAEKLSLNLAGKGIRLAVLSACETGNVDDVNAWTGIAPALTRSGVPAVVAMRYKIYDRNAITFSRAFFNTLVKGFTVDEAVANGRKEVFTLSDDEGERDWGVPVLYLRAEEGVIFPTPEGDAAATPAGGAHVLRAEAEAAGEEIDRRRLRTVMIQALSLEDLELLCADVQGELADAGIDLLVNLEMVGGASKPGKVLNLIDYLYRRRYLPFLVKVVRKNWPGLI